MSDEVFSEKEMARGLKQLDQLAKDEYGISLKELLEDQGISEDIREKRLSRLTGIILKKPFARKKKINREKSVTGAQYAWIWRTGDRWDRSLRHQKNHTEVQLLTNIRDTYLEVYYGTPFEKESDQKKWECFARDVDHERGLFKVLALWTVRKIKSQRTGTFDELLNAKESPEFALALNAADLMGQMGIAIAVASVVPHAGLAVGISLFIAKYGYAKYREWAESMNKNFKDNGS